MLKFTAGKVRTESFAVLIILEGICLFCSYTCFAQDDDDSLKPTTGSLEIVGSFDQYKVINYGTGAMGLLDDMKTSFAYSDDGSLEKMRKTFTASFGSDSLKLEDVSSITVRDQNGREFTSGYERVATIKNLPAPFAVIREDLTQIQQGSMGLKEAGSVTYILLPDVYSAEEASMLSEAFGGSTTTYVKFFNYNTDFSKMLAEMNMDPSLYFGQFPWDQFFAAFRNPEIWRLFEEYARQRQKLEYDEVRRRHYIDSFDGVTCRWGYENG